MPAPLPKNPVFVASGVKGARRRWGPPRRFNIGDLTDAQRELVAGLIEAQRLANAARQRDAEDQAA